MQKNLKTWLTFRIGEEGTGSSAECNLMFCDKQEGKLDTDFEGNVNYLKLNYR